MRKYFIDNLRWMAIFLLFPYHVFMIYNTFGEQFYINGTGNALASVFISLVWPWFMPLLFVLAGISSRYSLEGRTPAEYLKDRVLRLFVPLVFGIVLPIPCMTFLADKFHNGYAGNYFEHYTIFFTKWTDLSGSDGGFTPGHLWFILYLFIMSLITFPLMLLYKKVNKKIPVEQINPCVLLLLFIFPFVLQPILDISGKSLGEYTAFFLIGYFVLADNGIQDKCEKYRSFFLAIFLAGALFFLFVIKKNISVNGIIFDSIEELYSYSGILAFLGFGKKYLNLQNAAFRYFSTASFGVYLFHQLWIILAAYYLFKITGNSVLQIILILMVSVVLTFITYEICKRINIARFMFGLKSGG